jgi:glutaredoxin-like protein
MLTPMLMPRVCFGVRRVAIPRKAATPDKTRPEACPPYYGIPSGYEFSSIIEDVMMVSQGESGLSEATKTQVAELTEPVHLQVFVTPTCPYCPRAVRLAHQLALESDLIRADMVEAIEFPHLSVKYQVQGVPRTVINETVHIEGAVPEPMLMTRFKEAVN